MRRRFLDADDGTVGDYGGGMVRAHLNGLRELRDEASSGGDASMVRLVDAISTMVMETARGRLATTEALRRLNAVNIAAVRAYEAAEFIARADPAALHEALKEPKQPNAVSAGAGPEDGEK